MLLGTIFEDVPQIIITWRVEKETGNTNGSNSAFGSLAVANILASVFNRLVRAADAFDQRMDAPVRKKVLNIYRGHNIVFSVDTIGNDQFISGSFDRTIKLWNISADACIRTFEGHTDYVNSVATIGDDRFISGSWDETIILWLLPPTGRQGPK
jgi:WD40 repeat protein